jgi:hypothetical protein
MRSMSPVGRAVLLLLIQAALVLSIAGKYLYERMTCPRVWVRAAQYNPNAPLRGRYLAMQLAVDACGLPRDEAHRYRYAVPSSYAAPYVAAYSASWRWTVRLEAQGGRLVPVLASGTDRPEMTAELTVWGDEPCDRARLTPGVDYFISDTAKNPFPLSKGEELWVEVTVPPMGPPRPIQLAMSEDGVFTPLVLR